MGENWLTSFDAAYYLGTYPDVDAQYATFLTLYALRDWNGDGVEDSADYALWHYAAYGWQEGRTPTELFDTAFYLANNPDVADAGINPFMHFVSYGMDEGRPPNASIPDLGAFDAAAYIAAYADLEGFSDAEAYAHYLQYGIGEGRSAQTTDGDPVDPMTILDLDRENYEPPPENLPEGDDQAIGPEGFTGIGDDIFGIIL
jgi:hypothetical protein